MATKTCPTCKQALPSAGRRVCAACKNPINKHDKWFFMTENEHTFVVHRHCDNPQSYVGKDLKQGELV